MTISCSGYKILHTVAPGFRKEPTNDFNRALDDVPYMYNNFHVHMFIDFRLVNVY